VTPVDSRDRGGDLSNRCQNLGGRAARNRYPSQGSKSQSSRSQSPGQSRSLSAQSSGWWSSGWKGKAVRGCHASHHFQVSRAPPPDSGVVPFSKKPRLANQERAWLLRPPHAARSGPFEPTAPPRKILRRNSERATAMTLPTGLADTRSQPLQRKAVRFPPKAGDAWAVLIGWISGPGL
jgi:hypothetical protein